MKAMMKIALCACFIFVGACSSGGNNSDGNKDGNQDGKETLFSVEPVTALEEPNSPYGLWESNDIKGEAGITFKMRLRIGMDRIVAAVRCTFPDAGSVVAQAEAPGRIVGNKMIVDQDINATESLRDKNGQIYNCSSTLSKQTEQNAPEFTIIDGLMNTNEGSDVVLRKIGN